MSWKVNRAAASYVHAAFEKIDTSKDKLLSRDELLAAAKNDGNEIRLRMAAKALANEATFEPVSKVCNDPVDPLESFEAGDPGHVRAPGISVADLAAVTNGWAQPTHLDPAGAGLVAQEGLMLKTAIGTNNAISQYRTTWARPQLEAALKSNVVVMNTTHLALKGLLDIFDTVDLDGNGALTDQELRATALAWEGKGLDGEK